MSGRRLNLDDRILIEVLFGQGLTQTQIAAEVGVHPSTITREFAAHHSHRHGTKHGRRPAGVPREQVGHGHCPRSCRNGYDARYAQRKSEAKAPRPRPAKLGFEGPLPAHTTSLMWAGSVPTLLRRTVINKLEQRWSPEQISAWLSTQFPFNPEMWVSHETIYQAIFVQTRGNLRAELSDQVALRSGRVRRRPTPVPGGAIRSGRSWAEGFSIATRPAEVADRAVPGHWEGDLVIGKGSTSAIITLVERQTRYVMLGHLPLTRGTQDVVAVLSQLAQRLPQDLLQSVTWDRGNEMAAHAAFTVATGCSVFFADPYKPWQRGTNENTNGLLRQYYPKGDFDFRTITQDDLDVTAAQLNDRPRQTLGWDTPRWRLQQLLVASAA